jgi:voltage-gated potassium channel
LRSWPTSGRDGYVDAAEDDITLLDAFYYATVSVTTTGYGDIRPESDSARLVTTLLVTPARVLFLIVLVGTTLELLAERTRAAYRLTRWRKTLKDHTIICGYGTKGRAAVHELQARGVDLGEVVVIDDRPQAREQAVGRGPRRGRRATRRPPTSLRQAGSSSARPIVVAPDRRRAAVLITLTARSCTDATIVAACAEEENAHLLRQGGADNVVTSSGAAGPAPGHGGPQPRPWPRARGPARRREGLDLIEHHVAQDGPDVRRRRGQRAGASPWCATARRCASTIPRLQPLERGDHLSACAPTGRPTRRRPSTDRPVYRRAVIRPATRVAQSRLSPHRTPTTPKPARSVPASHPSMRTERIASST